MVLLLSCSELKSFLFSDQCHNDSNGHGDLHHGIRLASWRWDEYKDHFIICMMVILAAGAKLLFHEVHWLSNRFPESCVLIVLGVITGHIIYFGLTSESQCDLNFPE